MIYNKDRTFLLKSLFLIFTIGLLSSCSGGDRKRTYKKTPLDQIITEYINQPNYSVILADMNYDEAQDKYMHRYQILVEKEKSAQNDTLQKADDVEVVDTGWKEVEDVFFEKNVDNLGMTVLSKKDGVLDKNAVPAGYDNYVGNERYGRWQSNSSGGSFWVWYGQYAFLSNLFYGPSHRYYRNDYMDYDRNYRGRRSYYGQGNNTYGTKSSSARTASSTWNSKSDAFKSKVRNSVQKSAAAKRSRSYSSNSSYSKTSRNSSRYSSSSSRSRSGGFGK